VADEVIVGRWDDVDAARRLATGVDAVTLEIEQIGVDALSAVAQIAPLRPGVEPIRIIQDKTLQKTWLAENEFPVGPFRVVRNEADLREAVPALGGQCLSQSWARRIRRARSGPDHSRCGAGSRAGVA
jgi:5-(carboxyamino)imidazole ribonucleotide synthase